MLISEIRYGKSTLPECCIHISRRLQEPYQSSFANIYNRMRENTGEDFSTIFMEEMKVCLGKLPVTGEERKIFLSLFSEEGFEENGMQIRTIEQSQELLRHIVERLEQENVEKCRMAVGLGIMSGMLLVIVLL